MWLQRDRTDSLFQPRKSSKGYIEALEKKVERSEKLLELVSIHISSLFIVFDFLSCSSSVRMRKVERGC